VLVALRALRAIQLTVPSIRERLRSGDITIRPLTSSAGTYTVSPVLRQGWKLAMFLTELFYNIFSLAKNFCYLIPVNLFA
jgi:hypothetical protein